MQTVSMSTLNRARNSMRMIYIRTKSAHLSFCTLRCVTTSNPWQWCNGEVAKKWCSVSDRLPHLVLVEKYVGRFSQQQISISQNEIQSEASLQAWLEIYAATCTVNVTRGKIGDLNP
jgi:hypothetical protein